MTRNIKDYYVLVLSSTISACLLSVWFSVPVEAQTGSSCANKGNCKFTCANIPGYSNDVHIDLSLLDSSSGPRFKKIKDSQGRSFTYDWNPCTTFTIGSCSLVHACQETGSQEYSLGSETLMYYSPDSKHFIIHDLNAEEGRQMKVILVYDEDEEGTVSDVDENSEKLYTMKLYTKYAPRGSASGDDDGGGGGGISLGTVLVIIFFTVLVLYLGTGIAFLKYRRGAQGKDTIPNYEFWAKMPGLIKDGCIFSAKKTKECVSSARERTGGSGEQNAGYEEIKS